MNPEIKTTAANVTLDKRIADNEAAVLGLAGRVVPPVGKGKGVLLIEDGGEYRLEPLD